MIIHQTKRIVAIATHSRSRKTGPGIQIWILDARQHPSDSRKSGDDSRNQCRGCPLSSYSGCYVMDMPLVSIFHKWKAGGYSRLEFNSPKWREFFSGQFVRFGAYGNPSLLPFYMVESIAGLARRATGYFHDWHLMSPDRVKKYGRYLMASCQASDIGPNDYESAKRLGLRAFTTGNLEHPANFGVQCLADSHGLTCGECGLCDGTNRRKTLPDVWIQPHGYQQGKASIV